MTTTIYEWMEYCIHFVPKYLTFDFFDTNFGHSSYSKYKKTKYNVIYYIMYFQYIFNFL
jgi:hypothetical protein